ncbi:MAG: hypothetical protein A2Y10_03655 [Planctomycetes bacterium GWF2_41_51]|nr:MAG: hypothetical protein A2Y10_03655 [Planctomycetes bacterium GWF2_41_51]HBG28839.1 hypothetical protein [Phycisphaerales bacterium]
MSKIITHKDNELKPTIVEHAGTDTIPKIYLGSAAVTEAGTWLVSFSRADEDRHGKIIPERVFVTRSTDQGQTWQPRHLVYDGKDKGARQAEMGQLIPVPGKSRIYMVSIRHTGFRFGRLVYTYSNDDGCTWLGPNGPNSAYDINVPPYTYAPKGDGNHLMSKGIFMSNGEYMLPFSIATDPEQLDEIESEAVFMICDNLLTEDNPAKLNFKFYPAGKSGVRVPKANNANASLAQEPHVVEMSNGTLMCTLRTGRGCIYYCTSNDFGRNWTEAKPLGFAEGGNQIPHPNAPCPFYRLRNGKYVLFHHNNNGSIHGADNVFDFRKNRRPLFICIGRELPHCKTGTQPIMFTSPRFVRDSDGTPESILRTTEISCYAGIIEDERGVFFIHSNKWARLEAFKIPYNLLDDSCLY